MGDQRIQDVSKGRAERMSVGGSLREASEEMWVYREDNEAGMRVSICWEKQGWVWGGGVPVLDAPGLRGKATMA